MGLDKLGNKDKDGSRKEVKQLNDRTVWKPVHPNDLTKDEKRKAMESLFFYQKKRDGTTKGRMRANGSTQRSFISKEEASIPRVTTESVLITSVVDSKQERDIMHMDIPNAFV